MDKSKIREGDGMAGSNNDKTSIKFGEGKVYKFAQKGAHGNESMGENAGSIAMNMALTGLVEGTAEAKSQAWQMSLAITVVRRLLPSAYRRQILRSKFYNWHKFT
jgi:hypothetical protein